MSTVVEQGATRRVAYYSGGRWVGTYDQRLLQQRYQPIDEWAERLAREREGVARKLRRRVRPEDVFRRRTIPAFGRKGALRTAARIAAERGPSIFARRFFVGFTVIEILDELFRLGAEPEYQWGRSPDPIVEPGVWVPGGTAEPDFTGWRHFDYFPPAWATDHLEYVDAQAYPTVHDNITPAAWYAEYGSYLAPPVDLTGWPAVNHFVQGFNPVAGEQRTESKEGWDYPSSFPRPVPNPWAATGSPLPFREVNPNFRRITYSDPAFDTVPFAEPLAVPKYKYWGRQVTSVSTGEISRSSDKARMREPPRRREKEKKYQTRSERLRHGLMTALDVLSEGAEIIDAAYDALPPRIRRRWEEKLGFHWAKVNGKWKWLPPRRWGNRFQSGANAGQFGIDGAHWKAQALRHNWDKVDADVFAKNVLDNALQDILIGGIQRRLPRNIGHAVDDAVKLLEGARSDLFNQGLGAI